MSKTQNNFEKYDEYLSKSRVKTWVTCPRKFYYKYVEKRETEETESMIRGTIIHEMIEGFYENAIEYAEENDKPPSTLFNLLPVDERDDWQEYLNPYLSQFLAFERRRWKECDSIEEWVPVSVEDEKWKHIFPYSPIAMGLADVIIPAKSIPHKFISYDTGCILIDFKTGEPNESYMSYKEGGVYLDLAYYSMLFEDEFNIVGVGAYYPKRDKLVVSEIDRKGQEFVAEKVNEIKNANEHNIDDYSLNMGPLCMWGGEEGEQCDFYEDCASTWGKPIEESDTVVEYIQNGLSNKEIAEKLDCTEDSVSYWVRKKRWHRYRE